MRTSGSPRLALLLLVALPASCAYYNSLYNARRMHDKAETQAAEGNVGEAARSYEQSIEKAARSLEKDPDGRWSDDALLIIGQSHFALGHCDAAIAALERATRETGDDALLARANTYLGASYVCLDRGEDALPRLDSAVAHLEPATPTAALAHLWRARARFDTDVDTAGAWTDLAAAAGERHDRVAREARLEQIVRAADYGRPDVGVPAFRAIIADAEGDLFVDSIIRLSARAARAWGAAPARDALDGAPRAPWPDAVRDRLGIQRASLAASAGDTARALDELQGVAARSTVETASRARVAIARLQLSRAATPSDLETVRATLLPALSDPASRPLVQSIGTVASLLDRAEAGQPLAFFAAGEVARDQLGARPLARSMFRAYAALTPGTPWATKALAAALVLGPPPAQADSLRDAIAGAQDVYAAALRGQLASGYDESEERLGRTVKALVERARQQAAEQDIAVGSAIAELDSVASAARADTTRLRCGLMLDSLGLGGIRRDSVGAACLRSDQPLVDSFLAVDTTALLDSTATPVDARERARQERERGSERPQ